MKFFQKNNLLYTMKTVNIRTDAATTIAPVLIPFQGAPHDIFTDDDENLG
jgi:hypothetical protein